ncbi:MAG: 16S rRNA processing protein RimM [Rhodobacteraceae bacterium]|nr:16S rRNA processing protein RimM [Paracoccaceae bacterium]
MANTRICVGVIAGSFGVRGEARLKSFCAEPSAIADYGPLFTEDGSRSFTITITRPLKGGFGARLSGVASKEQADAMKGTRLFADRDALPALPDDEYYHSDLIGLEAVDTGGTSLGRVSAVHDHGAGDLLELADGTLIPFTLALVPTVDLAAGRLVVDLPEGLI